MRESSATNCGTISTNPQHTVRPGGASRFDETVAAIARIPKGEFRAAQRRALDRVPPDRHRRLNGAVLAAVVARINRGSGYCFPSLERIASDAGCSRRSVVNVLRRLEALGLVVKRHQRSAAGDMTSNRYTVPAMLLGSCVAAVHNEPDLFAWADGACSGDNIAPPVPPDCHYPAGKFAPEPTTTRTHQDQTHKEAPATDGVRLRGDDCSGEVELPSVPYREALLGGRSIGIGTRWAIQREHGIRDFELFEGVFLRWAATRPEHKRPRCLDSVALSFARTAIPRMSEAMKSRMLQPARWALASDGGGLEARAASEGWRDALVAFVDREGRLPEPGEADRICADEMRRALGLEPTAEAPRPLTIPAVNLSDLAASRSRVANAKWQKARRH